MLDLQVRHLHVRDGPIGVPFGLLGVVCRGVRAGADTVRQAGHYSTGQRAVGAGGGETPVLGGKLFLNICDRLAIQMAKSIPSGVAF